MRRTTQWVKAAWLGAAGVALLYVFLGYWLGHWPGREENIGLLGVLLVLSFPIGFIGAFIVGWLSDLLPAGHVLFANRYLEASVIWLCLTTLGWLQWFVILPRLVRFVRDRLRNSRHRAA